MFKGPLGTSVVKGQSGWQGSCTCSACFTCTACGWVLPVDNDVVASGSRLAGTACCWCCLIIVLWVYHSLLRMHLPLRAPLFAIGWCHPFACRGLCVVVGACVGGWEAVNLREGLGVGCLLFRHLLVLERDVLSNREGICCSMTEPCQHTGLQRAAVWLAQSVDWMVRLLIQHLPTRLVVSTAFSITPRCSCSHCWMARYLRCVLRCCPHRRLCCLCFGCVSAWVWGTGNSRVPFLGEGYLCAWCSFSVQQASVPFCCTVLRHAQQHPHHRNLPFSGPIPQSAWCW